MDTLPDDVRCLVEHLVSSIQAQDRSLHGLTQLLNRVEEECSALHCITRNEVQANDSSPRLEPVDISDAPDEMPELFDGPDSSDDDSDSAIKDKHLSPPPPEPRLIEVLHDSSENISDEHCVTYTPRLHLHDNRLSIGLVRILTYRLCIVKILHRKKILISLPNGLLDCGSRTRKPPLKTGYCCTTEVLKDCGNAISNPRTTRGGATPPLLKAPVFP